MRPLPSLAFVLLVIAQEYHEQESLKGAVDSLVDRVNALQQEVQDRDKEIAELREVEEMEKEEIAELREEEEIAQAREQDIGLGSQRSRSFGSGSGAGSGSIRSNSGTPQGAWRLAGASEIVEPEPQSRAQQKRQEHNSHNAINLCEIMEMSVSPGSCRQEVDEYGMDMCHDTWLSRCGIKYPPPEGFNADSTFNEMCRDACAGKQHISLISSVYRAAAADTLQDHTETVAASEKEVHDRETLRTQGDPESSWPLGLMIGSAVGVAAVLVALLFKGYRSSDTSLQGRRGGKKLLPPISTGSAATFNPMRTLAPDAAAL